MSTRTIAAVGGACLVALAGCGSHGAASTAGDAGGQPPGDDAGASGDAGGNEASTPTGDGGASGAVNVDARGNYSIVFQHPAWTFAGSLGVPATSIIADSGTDGIGPYHEVTFAFTDTSAKTGGIRVYDQLPAAVLTEGFVATATNDGPPFPTFTTYPQVPYHVTYSDTEFSPVSFDTLTPDSPFVFFDADANAFILSAASDFMNAATAELASGALSSGIDPAVTSLPAGLSHRTVLVAQPGINAAYATWGGVLTGLSGKKRVANDATPYLERFGYWTDNGAYYYYNYETTTGYPATLAGRERLLRAARRSPGVHAARQLVVSRRGRSSSWNDKADGQYTYTADTTVLPDGLPALRQSLGMPLVTHARWIDPSSPYRAQYTMSEQRLDRSVVLDHDRQLHRRGRRHAFTSRTGSTRTRCPITTNLTDQEAFMDDMASAMAKSGIDMQYCMPLPRHYLQGSKYQNLTTTRVSVDRFSSPRYVDFLYVSLLTSSLGAWPWSDTFNSTETDNLLLSTLSAGMVGVGDEIGTASATNLAQAVRPDGVIVKPDVPIVPIDQTFLDQASGMDAPLVAATYSDFGGMRASYVYAFSIGTNVTASFTPAALGYTGQVVVLDYFQGTAQVLAASATYTEELGNVSSYYVVVPVGPSGIALPRRCREVRVARQEAHLAGLRQRYAHRFGSVRERGDQRDAPGSRGLAAHGECERGHGRRGHLEWRDGDVYRAGDARGRRGFHHASLRRWDRQPVKIDGPGCEGLHRCPASARVHSSPHAAPRRRSRPAVGTAAPAAPTGRLPGWTGRCRGRTAPSPCRAPMAATRSYPPPTSSSPSSRMAAATRRGC